MPASRHDLAAEVNTLLDLPDLDSVGRSFRWYLVSDGSLCPRDSFGNHVLEQLSPRLSIMLDNAFDLEMSCRIPYPPQSGRFPAQREI